jgi:hypothetical protein
MQVIAQVVEGLGEVTQDSHKQLLPGLYKVWLALKETQMLNHRQIRNLQFILESSPQK